MLTIKEKFSKLSTLSKKLIVLKNKNDLLEEIYKNKLKKAEQKDYENEKLTSSLFINNL
jgi:hypothetical protein